VGAHLEQVTARFAANLACLATARASLSWFGISFPLPKYISSGVWLSISSEAIPF
jgi:hypothetical protein